MINVQEIRRNVINVVKNYSDAQVKVRKATSNEPWGPSSTLMSEIADLTYNVVAFSEIMQIIWKRLNDHGKNWRHVYKALVLLEYLIKTGSEKVAQQCRDNLFAIQTLKDFQYFEDSKDQGLSIREKSKMLVNLLKDEEKLKTERIRALKAKERFAQSLSAMGTSLEATELPKTSSSYHESLSSQGEGSSSRAANLNPELENARPQTVGEEELQLQLALAMSKEEAEQEERLRKNDDLRLKLALEESEKAKQAESRSAVDDLLSLNAAPLPKGDAVATDPWGSPLNGHNSTSLLPSPPNKSRPQQSQALDPWGTPTLSNAVPTSFETERNTAFVEDPWGAGSSNARPTSAINDPWGAGTNNVINSNISSTPASNDPWNLNNTNGDAKTNEISLGDFIEPSKINHYPTNDSIRRTPESFLGSNSNLVNLDALVSNKSQTSTSPSNNPFAAALPAPSNPFQTNKPSPPSMNQLRAQSTHIGGTTTASYSNATALSSLFNSPSISTSPLPVNGSSLISHPTALALGGGVGSSSAWASFPNGGGSQPQQPAGSFAPTFPATSPSQNNPFAM